MNDVVTEEDEENGSVFIGYLDLLTVISLFGITLEQGRIQSDVIVGSQVLPLGTLLLLFCFILVGLLSEMLKEKTVKSIYVVSLVVLPASAALLAVFTGMAFMVLIVVCIFNLIIHLCCGTVRFLMLNFSGLPFVITMCLGACMASLTLMGAISDPIPFAIALSLFSSLLGALSLKDARLFFKDRHNDEFFKLACGIIGKARNSLVSAFIFGLVNGLLVSVLLDGGAADARQIPMAFFIGITIFSITFINTWRHGFLRFIFYPLSTLPFLAMVLWGQSDLAISICVSVAILFVGMYIGYYINLAYSQFEISVTQLNLTVWMLLFGIIIGTIISLAHGTYPEQTLWLLYFAPPAIIIAQYLDLGPTSSAISTSRFQAPEVGHSSVHDASISEKTNRACDRFDLSPRQREIVFLLAKGRNAKYIADELNISANTAKTHIHNIYQRMDVNSQQELISLVEEWHD